MENLKHNSNAFILRPHYLVALVICAFACAFIYFLIPKKESGELKQTSFLRTFAQDKFKKDLQGSAAHTSCIYEASICNSIVMTVPVSYVGEMKQQLDETSKECSGSLLRDYKDNTLHVNFSPNPAFKELCIVMISATQPTMRLP